MKRWVLLLTVYVLVHTAKGDGVRAYEGQSNATITSLLTAEGITGDFITQKVYSDFLRDHPIEKDIDPERDQAKIDLNSAAKTDTERINALIKYLGLDR